MSNLELLIKKDYLEIRRTKKMLVLIILFLFVAIASPITAKMMPQILKMVNTGGIVITLPDPTYRDAVDQFIKNISQLGILILIFLVAGTVAEEKNRKSLEVILTKPVSRREFILSKFVTYLGVISGLFILAALVFYLYTASLFSGLGLGSFAAIAGMTLLYILTITSFTITASTLAKNSLAAAGMGFLFFVGFSLVSSLAHSWGKYLPDSILTNYPAVLGGTWDRSLTVSFCVNGALIILAILVAVRHFRSQEIER